MEEEFTEIRVRKASNGYIIEAGNFMEPGRGFPTTGKTMVFETTGNFCSFIKSDFAIKTIGANITKLKK